MYRNRKVEFNIHFPRDEEPLCPTLPPRVSGGIAALALLQGQKCTTYSTSDGWDESFFLSHYKCKVGQQKIKTHLK